MEIEPKKYLDLEHGIACLTNINFSMTPQAYGFTSTQVNLFCKTLEGLSDNSLIEPHDRWDFGDSYRPLFQKVYQVEL